MTDEIKKNIEASFGPGWTLSRVSPEEAKALFDPDRPGTLILKGRGPLGEMPTTHSLTTVYGIAETPEMYRQRAGRCPGEHYRWPARSGAILGAWGVADQDGPTHTLALGVLLREELPAFPGLPHEVPTPTIQQIRAWVAWALANRIDPHRARAWVLPDGEPAFLLDGRARGG